MRTPSTSSSASGRRSRFDQSLSAAACSAGGASAPGSERCSSSPQAAARSCALATKSSRCWSKWRCTSQPETSANSASATSTVR